MDEEPRRVVVMIDLTKPELHGTDRRCGPARPVNHLLDLSDGLRVGDRYVDVDRIGHHRVPPMPDALQAIGCRASQEQRHVRVARAIRSRPVVSGGDELANQPVVDTSVLVEQREIGMTNPGELDMFRPFQPWSREVTIDVDEEVELAAPVDASAIRRLPVGQKHQPWCPHQLPAGLLFDLTRQGIHQRLARFDVTSDDVPAARKELTLPTASVDEHAAIAIPDQRPNRTPAMIRFRVVLKTVKVDHGRPLDRCVFAHVEA